MRVRAALLLLGAAAASGVLVGALVLPDGGLATGPTSAVPSAPSPSRASPSPSPSPTATPTDAEQAPLTTADLLTVADFSTVGLKVTAQRPDVRLELVGCDKLQTLDDVADSGPPVQQRWEAETIVAFEQAVSARDVEEAATTAKTALTKIEACQKTAPGHWVYGPTHTARLGPETTVSWLGSVDGELNTTGRAPSGEKVNGGIAVVRNGTRVAVFQIAFCASAGDGAACVVAPDGSYEQLVALSRAAATRLG